jgi:pimeloyl-ACP methyl ester carboxylesterase/DNA-binding NarL/FixJ family response regulator
LEDFIGKWNNAGLDLSQIRKTVAQIDAFDTTFEQHLNRAATFLERHQTQGASKVLDEVLAPFENAAAMVLDNTFTVLSCNDAAHSTFGMVKGGSLDALPLNSSELDVFQETLRTVSADPNAHERLLNLEMSETGRPILLHIRRLAPQNMSSPPLILVVTTQYYWQPILGQTLNEVFGLTDAEQGVVRELIEGQDAKSIAENRKSSIGTVRSQIKSVLAKMNAHSQAEVIRLVLSLRDVISRTPTSNASNVPTLIPQTEDWLEKEAWKPFKTITLPDGRRMDYHDQGPPTGAPILFTHMGYGQMRWPKRLLKLAFRHGLRAICPIRAGYGDSDNIDSKADIMKSTRDDTLFLLNHLGIKKLPYVAQGNDLMFAVDFAAEHPKRVCEIIGVCARPCLTGDWHYAAMGKWHRFFLSTAQHAPHLLYFTTRAAISLARNIGTDAMFRNINRRSPSDMRTIDDDEIRPILIEGANIVLGAHTNAAQAYTMEVLKTESDWSDRIIAARKTPIWSVNGAEDPSLDVSVIAEYRDKYPWIRFEVIEDAGQMLFYQHPDKLIPRIAEAAQKALDN